jgi:hypothetical protein
VVPPILKPEPDWRKSVTKRKRKRPGKPGALRAGVVVVVMRRLRDVVTHPGEHHVVGRLRSAANASPRLAGQVGVL